MDDVTIITGFFDIGRGNRRTEKRDNSIYLDYFKSWAKINNKIIIYTNKEISEKVLQIRSEFGLYNETKIFDL